MADNIRATPRNEFLGLLADAMYGGLDWMKDPRRTQQIQGLAGLLESTGIPKTTERMAYGEPLTNIGRANVPLLKPETADALMTVAPIAKPAAVMAGRTGRAVGRMAGEEINAAMMGERGGLLGAVTPQPMFAVNLPKSIPGRIGTISPETKTEVKNLAETFAEEINKLGFSAKVEHSGSKAGASSYINVSDPLTGRFLSKPIRISDHSKGAKEYQGVIDILNPQDDFEKITDALSGMRGMGETLVFKQNKYADELIASGVKPKTAYQRAKTEITETQPSFQEFGYQPQQAPLSITQQRSGLLDMTKTPSEAEIKKMSREDLIQWLQNNDPDGQYMDPTPNPSVSMYRTSKGYAVENADSGDVFEFKDFNEAQEEFNSMRFSNAEFPPMTLQEAQESAINYLREFAQPEEGAKVIPFQSKGLLSP